MAGPAGGAAFFWHPVAASPIKTAALNPKMRLNALILTGTFTRSGLRLEACRLKLRLVAKRLQCRVAQLPCAMNLSILWGW